MKKSSRILTTLSLAVLLGLTAFGQSNTFPSSGSVGIGTTSPSKKLHVVQNGWKARFSGSDGYIDIGPANSSWAHIYSDRPRFIFNKPVYSMNGFLSYNSTLNLEAASGHYVQIKPRSSSYGLILREYNSNDYGNIEVTSAGLGFGYKTSGYKLLVNTSGNVGVGCNPGSTTFKVYKSSLPSLELASSVSRLQIGMATCGWCYASGARSGDAVLRTLGGYNSIILSIPNDNNDGNSYIGFADGHNGLWMKVLNNRTVRIDGKVYAKEVRCRTNVWSDFVFDTNYELRSLEEVESFIDQNNHLPDVPNEDQVMEEGVNVGEMDAILLQKIEELTLYVIEQNKKIKSLEEQINSRQ